jgi:hypothetical protein
MRRRCLEAFADAVVEADHHSEGLWAITCTEEKIRLQVGRVIICNIAVERMWMALDRDSLARGGKEALLERSKSWQWSSKDSRYREIPTRNGYYLPSEDHEDIWPEIRELHFNAIRRAAERGGLRSRTKENHSPGVLEYLKNTLGRSLPDPAFSG